MIPRSWWWLLAAAGLVLLFLLRKVARRALRRWSWRHALRTRRELGFRLNPVTVIPVPCTAKSLAGTLDRPIHISRRDSDLTCLPESHDAFNPQVSELAGRIRMSSLPKSHCRANWPIERVPERFV